MATDTTIERDSAPATDTTAALAKLARELVFKVDPADRRAAERRILDLIDEEHRAAGTWPKQRTDAREQAISDVLSEVSGACYSIRQLACEAIQRGGSSEGAAMLEGLEALAGKVGALADRVSYMLTRDPGIVEDETWLYSPRACEALKTLQGDKATTAD